MRMADIPAETIERARAGDSAAIDAILLGSQPAVFNLAVRMLGNREDASDACQDVLLKVVTHLGTWRGEASFGTWVFQIARNHLLNARTRTREFPAASLDDLGGKLAQGLAYGAGAPALTPEDKADAREVAVRCTQGMLMCLDREGRLTYLLDVVFGLDSPDAARVLGINDAAYRKRLSRVRGQLRGFAGSACGLVQPEAACRCDRQLPAARAISAPALALTPPERAEAAAQFDRMVHLGDVAAVLRAHPEYRAPAVMAAAIRTILRQQGDLAG